MRANGARLTMRGDFQVALRGSRVRRASAPSVSAPAGSAPDLLCLISSAPGYRTGPYSNPVFESETFVVPTEEELAGWNG